MTRSSVAGEVGVPILLRLRLRGEGDAVARRSEDEGRDLSSGEGKTALLGGLTLLSGEGDTRPLPPASSPEITPPSLGAGSLRPG